MQERNSKTVAENLKSWMALVAMLICISGCGADGPADYRFRVVMNDPKNPHVNDVLADYLNGEGFKIIRERRTDEFGIVDDMFIATKPLGFRVLSLSKTLSGHEDKDRCGDFQGVGHKDPGQFVISIWNDWPHTDEPVAELNSDLRQMLAERGFEVLDAPVECSALVESYAPS